MCPGREPHGLCDVDRAARRYANGAQAVPLAQLLYRDTEAIGNGDERVAATQRVALLARKDAAAAGDRHDQFVIHLQWLGCRDLVERCDLRGLCMQTCGNAFERFTGLHDVESPGTAFVFGMSLRRSL